MRPTSSAKLSKNLMLIKGLLVQEWLEGGAKPEGGVLVGGGLARFHVSIGSVEKLHEVVDSDS
ncbi:hypothetical protein, partial [Stutzerimonas nosocomialis]|uniref:hypothetical protein n=1 Tax=Stutzerimonas nosocomialis TaxID=1056496 RepID=UPI0011094232